MKEFCTTYILQIIGITFSIILFPSCASFDSARPTVVNSDKSTIHKINGRYLIYPSKVDTSHLNYVDNLDDNLIQELDRKPFKSRYDSLYYDSTGNLFVELLLEKKILTITYLRGEEIIQTKKVKVKVKKDGYIYLKNKNIKLWGIPFAFGALNISRKRIAIINETELLLETTEFHGGGFLLIIFANAGRTKYKKHFKKI